MTRGILALAAAALAVAAAPAGAAELLTVTRDGTAATVVGRVPHAQIGSSPCRRIDGSLTALVSPASSS